ncbi:MAG TPA: hypothetical protein VNL15_01070 [Dehalococcoidia bacterium]|nr:hypothetical protein [Dehalococcoidia bacterium]
MQPRRIPLYLVLGRIVAVSGVGFASALGLFFLIAGIWHIGLIALAATAVFIYIMFAIERGRESEEEDTPP